MRVSRERWVGRMARVVVVWVLRMVGKMVQQRLRRMAQPKTTAMARRLKKTKKESFSEELTKRTLQPDIHSQRPTLPTDHLRAST